MNFIKVINKIYTDPQCRASFDGGKHWEHAKPELYPCNLWEWILHYIFRKHFSWGQPFCVVCGKEQEDYIDGHEIDGI
jgi:hypothetical protein